MIITVTLNPGLDLTYTLPELGPEVDVHRASRSTLEASGKGVNISRAVRQIGVPTIAVLPAGGPTGRYLVELLDDEGLAHLVTPQEGETRVNTTALRPGGITVKINGPGAALLPAEQSNLLQAATQALRSAQEAAVQEAAVQQTWLAVCGSLPPGVEGELVARLVDLAHTHGAKCAVDASGPALAAALTAGADLLAPNRRELAEVTALPRDGSLSELAASARDLSDKTAAVLLISLGQDGAMYADATHVLHGYGPPLQPVNTAGAGDALLAGWLSADEPPRARLARAIRWGRSACLAATTVDDTPGERDSAPVTVVDLTPDKSL